MNIGFITSAALFVSIFCFLVMFVSLFFDIIKLPTRVLMQKVIDNDKVKWYMIAILIKTFGVYSLAFLVHELFYLG